LVKAWRMADTRPQSIRLTTDTIVGSRPDGATERGKSARNLIWAGCFELQIVGQPAGKREQIVCWQAEDARVLSDQVPRAWAAPVLLNVVEVLGRDRPALLLHHARCELLLAETEPLAAFEIA